MINDNHDKSGDRRRGGFFGGIILMTIGVIILLNNFDLLPWSVWSTLWKFWPLFLILGGLENLLGDSFVAEIVVSVITFLIVVYLFVQIISVNNSNFKNWIKENIKWFPFNEKLFEDSRIKYRQRYFDIDLNEML